MHFDSHSPSSVYSSPSCYFSIVPSPSDHFSVETPSNSPQPLPVYSADTLSYPSNPLLAFRPPPYNLPEVPNTMDGSKLLQLQTSAAHRPDPKPLQRRPSPSASDSSTGTSGNSSPAPSSTMSAPSLQQLTCVRCRRTTTSSMINVGTSLYYCSHCAQMVGYGSG
ncbi:hypothetical protein BU24DRAFT_37565 [Aaosphaeria arxii CBS 175.79]|uniref:Uncharacterized protein n=1 Tax=Aaosphaeria arxii CBS 175.79 TaxID=1450172 RepID=A0A6A5Y933_9PLEO|nr:uncharacterized protein BU24DRAFT_37565 [Aaosphaeria arxii CBS 175.79]KAF2022112.1 hypothetical protein BU24DRAFT_37565 [Aaosphaeria arxii CBS 175.79]